METLVSWLPILGIVLIFWLLLIRPAQRRQRQLTNLQMALAVGDKVLTSAGIFGTVARIEDDKIGVEVADGVVITLARPAIVGVVPDREEPAEDEQAQDQSTQDEPAEDEPATAAENTDTAPGRE